jgi:hypothetical protein
MAQGTIGTIDPTTVSGSALATLLTAFGAAVNSGNLGTTAPSYITLGGTYTLQNSDGSYTMCMLTSAGQIPIYSWSASGGLVFAGNTNQAVTPGTVSGGNSISGTGMPYGGATVTLQLVGDVLTPGASYYYGTNTAGAKGWYVLPSAGVVAPQQLQANGYGPGTYSVAVPTNCNSALVTLIGAGGAASLGGRITFTASVTPGAALPLVVGSYAGSGPSGTYFLGGFAAGGDEFGNTGTVAAPAAGISTSWVPAPVGPSGLIAGDAAANGSAIIVWVTKNV